MGLRCRCRLRPAAQSLPLNGRLSRGSAESRSRLPMTWVRSDIVVASFAAAGRGTAFDPVRAQKLLFLVDREVSERIGGPYFDFQPYHYGPFDADVYSALEGLATSEDVRIDGSARCPRYSLTAIGYRRGRAVLEGLPHPVAKYIRNAARWIRLTPYRRILSALYRRYPDMAVNRVVGHWTRPRRNEPGSPFVHGMARAFDFRGLSGRARDSGRISRSDTDAIRDAWRAVGEELEGAMAGFGDSEHLW